MDRTAEALVRIAQALERIAAALEEARKPATIQAADERGVASVDDGAIYPLVPRITTP